MPTREKMSQDLKDELERIEAHEHAVAVKEYLDSALSIPIAYLHATFSPTNAEASPFEVEFYWDEPEFGSIAKLDLRADLLDKFGDDPAYYREQITQTARAMRAFADELDALTPQTTKGRH